MVQYADVVAVRLLALNRFLSFRVFGRRLILYVHLFRGRLSIAQSGLRHDFATLERLGSGAWLLTQL